MENGGGNSSSFNVISRNCFDFPGWVSSVPQLPFMYLEMQMLIVFFTTQLLNYLFFQRIGLPPLVSQLFAGLVLGYTGLGRFVIVRDVIFAPLSFPVIKCIIFFAYTLSLFVIATQIDFTIIKRTGKRIMMVGLSALFSALVANTLAVQLLKPSDKIRGDVQVALMMLPVTAFPVLVQLVTDIGLLNSELGRLALASGLLVEIASILLTMALNNIVPVLNDFPKLMQASLNMLGTGFLLLVIIFLFRPFMHFLIKMTPKDRPIKDTFLLIAFVSMLVGSLSTNFFSQFVFLGAFMMGGALPDGPPLGSALVDKLDSLFTKVLFPFFVTSAAMKINISSIDFHGPLLYNVIVLIVVSTLTKLVACFGCGIANKMAHRDALALAFIMTTKGFLEIGTMTWLGDMEIIGEECSCILALYVIFMASFVPIVVKLLYDPMRKYGGYQIRDIIHLKPNAGLKVVACVLRPENISTISTLLKFLSPATNVPVAAYVIHLVKLVGRCQPLFISHTMQKKQSSHHSYSDDVIWHFDRLQHSSNGAISAQVFTALAHVDAMHEYLCTLALDKVVSLIVLPFHRRFGIEGFIDIDDHEQRVLNTSVLARSPCSVAIFVDRFHILNAGEKSERVSSFAHMEEPTLSVAVLFIGGNDDREAVAFARRMSRVSRVRLTVLRLASPGDGEVFMNSLDAKAIDRILHESQYEDTSIQQQIKYFQVTVKDGEETFAMLRATVHEYDLMIVGRRFNSYAPQTAGLEDSCEIKELGILGDLLSSPDLKCSTSVLVVQQQQHWM